MINNGLKQAIYCSFWKRLQSKSSYHLFKMSTTGRGTCLQTFNKSR